MPEWRMAQKRHKSFHVLPEHPLQALISPACGCSPVVSLQDWCRAAPWIPAHKSLAWIHKIDIKNKARNCTCLDSIYQKWEIWEKQVSPKQGAKPEQVNLSVTAVCVLGLWGTASLLAAVGANKQQQLTARSHKQQFTPSTTKSGFCYDSSDQAAGTCHPLQALPSWLWWSQQG